MTTLKGLKYLTTDLCTEYNGIRTSYLPAIGKWMKHPEPGEVDGRDCGPGGWHIMLKCSSIYAPANWWPWHAELRGVLGQSNEKARGTSIRLRPISPALWWRYIRRFGGEANLQEANLQEANLWGANLQEANLQEANLQEANLQEANLRGANLRGANLREADLWGANLREADLWGANLQEANLWGANLWGANLRGANLRGANLREANLQEANLWGAKASGHTRWPGGFDPKAHGVTVIDD